MIEVRPYEGEATEFAAFTNRVWRETYAGRVLVPLWSKEHFERDLFADGRDKDLLIAAYDGARLVGTHPAKSMNVRLHGRTYPATWASYLSVDRDYRPRGVAMKLQMEYIQRHLKRQLLMNFGYLDVRSPGSIGPVFWRSMPGGVRLVAKLGMWMRVLDHAAFARFELHRRESLGALAVAPFQRQVRSLEDGAGIRPFRGADLSACLDLLSRTGAAADLAYLWTEDVANRQLSFPGLSRTIVLERDGAIAGLINYTLLDVLGRTRLRSSQIDVLAMDGLSPYDRSRLLVAGLHDMHAEGAKVVVMLRGSWRNARALFAAGFLPLPPEVEYVAMTLRPNLPLDHVRRLEVILR